MQKPNYGPTFKDCLHKYAQTHYRVCVWGRRRLKHSIIGAIALGMSITTAPLYFDPTLTTLPVFYGVLFLFAINVACWCGGFCMFTNKHFQSLKTKEFMAYATLDELCVVDYVRQDSK